ncbi:MAG: hypothetical protein US03_C0007G0008 [candidate division TM6 bacterium GW2011_GWF2_36_131]|nr:MAG: hypothetical protein US03_C0007G0008 [candidate division TM6 bacterium GW2011_GWF2_36_131]
MERKGLVLRKVFLYLLMGVGLLYTHAILSLLTPSPDDMVKADSVFE